LSGSGLQEEPRTRIYFTGHDWRRFFEKRPQARKKAFVSNSGSVALSDTFPQPTNSNTEQRPLSAARDWLDYERVPRGKNRSQPWGGLPDTGNVCCRSAAPIIGNRRSIRGCFWVPPILLTKVCKKSRRGRSLIQGEGGRPSAGRFVSRFTVFPSKLRSKWVKRSNRGIPGLNPAVQHVRI